MQWIQPRENEGRWAAGPVCLLVRRIGNYVGKPGNDDVTLAIPLVIVRLSLQVPLARHQ